MGGVEGVPLAGERSDRPVEAIDVQKTALPVEDLEVPGGAGFRGMVEQTATGEERDEPVLLSE